MKLAVISRTADGSISAVGSDGVGAAKKPHAPSAQWAMSTIRLRVSASRFMDKCFCDEAIEPQRAHTCDAIGAAE